jgi:TPR repeat protein
MAGESTNVELLFSLLESGRDREARSLCEKLVGQGHTELAVYLGWMYEIGKECDQNPELAHKYYALGAATGDAISQYYLGRFLLRMNKVTEGIKWIESAASQEFPPSLYRLSIFYRQGIFVTKDVKRAEHLLRTAASLGHFFAKREMISSALRFRAGLIPAIAALPKLIVLLGDAFSAARKDPFDARFVT